MTLSVAGILSALGSLERRFALTDLEKEERAIVYFIVDRLAAGRDVRLADVAGSGVCTRPSVYRHVHNLEAKQIIRLHGDKRVTITLAPRLSRFDKAFDMAVAKMPIGARPKTVTAHR